MHNGFLQVEGEKMSKSLGNFFTVHDLLRTYKFDKALWDPRAVRFAMLMTHYTQPIDWTAAKLYEAVSALMNFKLWGEDYPIDLANVYPPFLNALHDDLNTPKAISELFALMKDIKTTKVSDPAKDHRVRMLNNSLALIGIDSLANFESLKVLFESALSIEEIEKAINARKAARAAKNFAESDRIRDELLAKGIVLKDGPTGTTWEVKR